MDKTLAYLNQKEVFRHEDKRLMFILGRDDDANELINVCDVRTPVSKLLITSTPINDMSESEIIALAKKMKEDALAILNGY